MKFPLTPRDLALHDTWLRFVCAVFHWRGHWEPVYPNKAIDGRGGDLWIWMCAVEGCESRLTFIDRLDAAMERNRKQIAARKAKP